MRMQLALSKIRGASYHSKHHLRFVCVCVCAWYPKRHSWTCLDCQPVSQRDWSVVCAGIHQSVRAPPFHVLFELLPYIWHDLYSRIATSERKHTHMRAHRYLQIAPFFSPDSLCFFFSLFFPADEREDVQKKTFTKWVNSQLAKVRRLPVSFPPLFAASSVPCLSSPPSPTGPSDHTLQSLPLAVSARFCRDEFSARGGVSGGGERQRDTTLSP